MRVITANKIKANLALLSYYSLLLLLFIYASETHAAQAKKLGTVADLIRQSMGDIAALIVAVSYVSGIAFSMMGLLKLKAHKDNPTQVPLGQPVVLIVIGACLVFLPSLVKTTGQTIWGDSKSAVGTSGGQHDAADFLNIGG